MHFALCAVKRILHYGVDFLLICAFKPSKHGECGLLFRPRKRIDDARYFGCVIDFIARGAACPVKQPLLGDVEAPCVNAGSFRGDTS